MIEASAHRRNPSGTEFDTSAAQSGKTIEHTVEDQHRKKSFGGVKDASHVLGADHFCAAACVLAIREPVNHPFGIDRQLAAADVQHEGRARFRETRPNRIMSAMSR